MALGTSQYLTFSRREISPPPSRGPGGCRSGTALVKTVGDGSIERCSSACRTSSARGGGQGARVRPSATTGCGASADRGRLVGWARKAAERATRKDDAVRLATLWAHRSAARRWAYETRASSFLASNARVAPGWERPNRTGDGKEPEGHLRSPVCSGQMARSTALLRHEEPPEPPPFVLRVRHRRHHVIHSGSSSPIT